MATISAYDSNSISVLFSSLPGASGGNSMASLASSLSDYSMIRTGTYGKLMNDYFAKTDVKEFSRNFANQSRVTNSVSEDSAQTLADAKDTASALLNPEKNTYTDSAKYSPLYSAGSMWDSFF